MHKVHRAHKECVFFVRPFSNSTRKAVLPWQVFVFFRLEIGAKVKTCVLLLVSLQFVCCQSTSRIVVASQRPLMEERRMIKSQLDAVDMPHFED